MDIEDDLDLSELLAPVPPPANGSSRARRTIRRRRVLHRTASGLALAAVTVGAVMSMNASRDPSDDDVLAGRPAEAALLAVSRTDRGDEDFEFRVRVIDVATGKSRVLNTVSPEPIGEARLLSREGAVVLDESDDSGKHDVFVLRSPFAGRPRHIATGLRVIPALQRDRIWVIDAESPNPDGVNYTTSLRELDLNSHETASIVFPCCRTLIGQSEQGLVVASASGLEVIDPLTGTVIASDPDVMYPEAVDRSNVLYSKRSPACGETENQQIWLLDLATGAKRPFAGCYSRVGGFSPDGRSISLWTSGDGASATLTIMSLDGSERIEVPDSRSAEYRVAWDPEGRRLYFADSTGLNIRSFDLTTQESQLVVRLDGLVVALSATD